MKTIVVFLLIAVFASAGRAQLWGNTATNGMAKSFFPMNSFGGSQGSFGTPGLFGGNMGSMFGGQGAQNPPPPPPPQNGGMGSFMNGGFNSQPASNAWGNGLNNNNPFANLFGQQNGQGAPPPPPPPPTQGGQNSFGGMGGLFGSNSNMFRNPNGFGSFGNLGGLGTGLGNGFGSGLSNGLGSGLGGMNGLFGGLTGKK